MNDEIIKDQIKELIRDEIQGVINDYVDDQESVKDTSGIGFVETEDELKVNISQSEIDISLKEYKKIKKNQRSTLFEIKKPDS